MVVQISEESKSLNFSKKTEKDTAYFVKTVLLCFSKTICSKHFFQKPNYYRSESKVTIKNNENSINLSLITSYAAYLHV